MKNDNFRRLTLLFTVTYTFSYMTRVNFGAIISEIAVDTQIPKSLLSLALTGSFITYGAGQLISGILGDGFRPKALVFLGLVLSSLMNILIPFCNGYVPMIIVWSINGFAQAFMWPPIIRLMNDMFTGEEYKKASVSVSKGASYGTMAIYLLAPVLITLNGWQAVFVHCGMWGLVMSFNWHRNCPDLKVYRYDYSSGKEKKTKIFSPVMVCVMVAIILMGLLRDGVTTWMPLYISEIYHLGNAISILTGIALPIFSLACFEAASVLYRKKFDNPLMCSGMLFGVGAISTLLLLLFTGNSVILSVIFSALLTGCMYGVGMILICMIPPYFKKHGNVSTVSGVLNASAYIGSAIATYSFVRLSEIIGWDETLSVWFIVTVLGAILCIVCAPLFKKISTTNDNELTLE